MAVGRTERLDDVLAAMKKLADGRLCATGPDGVRDHRRAQRRSQRIRRPSERRCATRAELTTSRLNAIDGISVVAPTAAFYAMPKVALPPGVTDEDYVLGLLRATGVLCVYGSGFGAKPERRLLPDRVPRLARRARDRSTTTSAASPPTSWPTGER